MKTKDIKFLEIRYLRGPNIWTYRPVIEAIVDIGDLEDFPSNTIPGFYERLVALLPSLADHRCSYGEPGGFLRRVQEGTWPAHILEHVTLELQNLAGMPGGFGKARETSTRGVYKVVVRAWHEDVTRSCLHAGRDLLLAAIQDTSFDVAATVERLADAGIPLGNQTVLLRGINDCPQVLKELFQGLLKIRVRPYYLYQCDLSQGIEHFRTPVAAGLQAIEYLRGHTSGLAVPTYCIDAPGGGGKIPVMPQYLISQAPGRVVLRNFEGGIYAYTEPQYMIAPDQPCSLCGGKHEQSGIGVARMLGGQVVAMEPEIKQER